MKTGPDFAVGCAGTGPHIVELFAGGVRPQHPGRIGVPELAVDPERQQPLIVGIGIKPVCRQNRFVVVETADFVGGLFCLVQRRQQHGRQDRDDRLTATLKMEFFSAVFCCFCIFDV